MKSIEFKHPTLGEIIVTNGIPKEVNDKIGTRTNQLTIKQKPLYFGEITMKKGIVTINFLSVVKPKSFYVGFFYEGTRLNNSVYLLVNERIEDSIIVYPKSILSIIK